MVTQGTNIFKNCYPELVSNRHPFKIFVSKKAKLQAHGTIVAIEGQNYCGWQKT